MDCEFNKVVLLGFSISQTQDMLNKNLLKEAKTKIKDSVKKNTFSLRLALRDVHNSYIKSQITTIMNRPTWFSFKRSITLSTKMTQYSESLT